MRDVAPANLQSTPRTASNAGALLFLIGVPLLLVLIIGFTSPGYRITPADSVREHPVGGDFLQEYVGGKIWLNPEKRKQLYDAGEFRSIQHDPHVTSFRWREDRYFPPVYPPWWYAAVSPFSQLPYLPAARLWLALMGVSLIGALLALSSGFRAHPWLLIATCFSPPVLLSLGTGQKGTLWLLIFSVSLALLYKGKKALSGAVFSLLVFKPHLGLPVGIILLASCQWRWAASCAAGVFAVVAVTTFVEPGLLPDFVTVCQGMGDYVRTDGYKLTDGFSLWSGLHMLIPDSRLAGILAVVLTAVFLVLGIRSMRQALVNPESSLLRGMASLVLVTVMVSPHLYSYDLTLLILPAVLLWKPDHGGLQAHSDRLVAALLLLILFGKGIFVRAAEITGSPVGPILLGIACGLALAPRVAVFPGRNEANIQR